MKWAPEAGTVCIRVHDDVAPGDRQRPPHRVALAEHRPHLWQQLRLVVNLRAVPAGESAVASRDPASTTTT